MKTKSSFAKITSVLLCVLVLVLGLAGVGVIGAAAEETATADTYIIAGSESLCGSSWDATDNNNLMNQDGDILTLTFASVPAGDEYQFKIVKNGTDWIGDAIGNNFAFNVSETCDVTVKYNIASLEMDISGTGVEYPITSLKPDNICAVGNGSGNWLNGSAWYPSDSNNYMTEVTDGVYTITYTDVAAGSYELKFTANDSWLYNWGGIFEGFGVESAAVYNASNNIEFSIVNAPATVTLELDLSGYDHYIMTGATFTVTADPAQDTATEPTEPAENLPWDGTTIDTSWYNTTDTSLEIGTAAQLAGLAAIVNGTAEGITQDTFAGKTVTLTDDIDLGGKEWTPIAFIYIYDAALSPMGVFSGIFDGAGHSISNLYSNSDAYCAGLFGFVGGATVKDFTVIGADITNHQEMLAVICAGYAIDSNFSGIVIDESSVIRSDVEWISVVAGIVGCIQSSEAICTVTDCINNATITSPVGYANMVAGIAGQSSGEVVIENCVNNGNIDCAGDAIGGIMGQVNDGALTIRNCSNTGAITAGSSMAGGIVGCMNSNSGVVENCYNTGAITGSHEVGGIIGNLFNASVKNCYNTGSVASTNADNEAYSSAGGIVGVVHGATDEVSFCYNVGEITSNFNSSLGAIAGVNKGVLSNNAFIEGKTAFGSSTGTQENNTAFPTSDFARGRVTHFLNGDMLTETSVWRQTISEDAYPNFTGGIVHSFAMFICAEYTNTEDGSHIIVTGGDCSVDKLCPVCGDVTEAAKEHTDADPVDKICDECGNKMPHVHNWDMQWTSDGTAHWLECVDEDCDITENSQKNLYGEHSFSDSDSSICTVCKNHIHSDMSFDSIFNLVSGELWIESCYLVDNITATGNITIPAGANVSLCLNGYTLDLAGFSITVSEGAALNLYDCGEGKITTLTTASNSAAIVVQGTYNQYSGTVENTSTSSDTNAIITDNGDPVINIEGGKILGKTGIHLNYYGHLTVTGSAYIEGSYTGIDLSGGVTAEINSGTIKAQYAVSAYSTSVPSEIIISGNPELNGSSYAVFSCGILRISGGRLTGGTHAIYIQNENSETYLSGSPEINAGSKYSVYFRDSAQYGEFYASENGVPYTGTALTLYTELPRANTPLVRGIIGNEDKFSASLDDPMSVFNLVYVEGEADGHYELRFTFSGTGTEEDPFLVSTDKELQAAMDNIGEINYVKLASDITASKDIGLDYEWTPLVLDLDGHTLAFTDSGLAIRSSAVIKNGTITSDDTSFATINIYGSSTFNPEWKTVLENLTVISDKEAAVEVDDMTLEITNCNLTGYNYTLICDCYSAAYPVTITVNNVTLNTTSTYGNLYVTNGGVVLMLDGVEADRYSDESSYHTHLDTTGDCICERCNEYAHKFNNENGGCIEGKYCTVCITVFIPQTGEHSFASECDSICDVCLYIREVPEGHFAWGEGVEETYDGIAVTKVTCACGAVKYIDAVTIILGSYDGDGWYYDSYLLVEKNGVEYKRYTIDYNYSEKVEDGIFIMPLETGFYTFKVVTTSFPYDQWAKLVMPDSLDVITHSDILQNNSTLLLAEMLYPTDYTGELNGKYYLNGAEHTHTFGETWQADVIMKTHYRVCECGLNSEAEPCSLATMKYEGDVHYLGCDTCTNADYSTIAEHEYIITVTGTHHTMSCTGCDYSSGEVEHSYEWRIPCKCGALTLTTDEIFEDAIFRTYLSEAFDTNKDGILETAEIQIIKNIYVTEMGITSLSGIEYLPELQILECADNSIKSLNVSFNTKLETLICIRNEMTELILGTNSVLEVIECGINNIATLDISGLSALETFSFKTNPNCNIIYGGTRSTIKTLTLSYNSLTEFDASAFPALETVYLDWNELTSLDFSSNANLTYVYAAGNMLTSLKLPEGYTGSTFIINQSLSISIDLKSMSADITGILTDISAMTIISGGTLSENGILTVDEGVKNVEYAIPTNVDGISITGKIFIQNSHTHIYNAEGTDPTCTESGSKTYTCADPECGKTYTEELDPLGHTAEIDEAVAPTCTTSGLTEGSHCSVCKETLTAQETIDPLGHTAEIDEAVAPTCTTSGLTEGSHCSVCKETLTAQETVDPLGHTAGEEATCTTAQLCTVCNTELAPATGHSFGEYGEWVDNGDGTQTKTATCICGETTAVTEDIPDVDTPDEPTTPDTPDTPAEPDSPVDDADSEGFNFFAWLIKLLKKIIEGIIQIFKGLFA